MQRKFLSRPPTGVNILFISFFSKHTERAVSFLLNKCVVIMCLGGFADTEKIDRNGNFYISIKSQEKKITLGASKGIVNPRDMGNIKYGDMFYSKGDSF